MFYIWLFIAISLAILEMTTTNLVSIWFIISSLVAMVTSLFIESITIQITIFVLLGLLLSKFITGVLSSGSGALPSGTASPASPDGAPPGSAERFRCPCQW